VNDNIEVYVNDKKFSVYRGMKVKHALIAYDPITYKDALSGKIRVEDANGFVIGLEGSLADKTRIFTRDSRPETRKS